MKILNSPRSVDINITSKCNSKCAYCSHFTSASDAKEDLPLDEWLLFFSELAELSVLHVTLSGGEPFMYKNIKGIIQGIVDCKMRYSILSNGILIDENTAKFIASTKRCNRVQISIDGHKKELHEITRGSNTFDEAVKAIKILQKHNINVDVRMTINKHNVSKLKETARFILQDLKLHSFSTNSAGYMGMCRENSDDLQLDNDLRYFAMEELMELKKVYGSRITATAGPLTEAKAWEYMEKSRKGEKTDCFFEKPGYLSGCGCTFTSLAVRSDGVIVPCVQMSHIELGRINQDNLSELWKDSRELLNLRLRRNINLTSVEYCKDCEYINYCTGGCPAIAYNITGEVNSPSPDFCLREYLKDGGKLCHEYE